MQNFSPLTRTLLILSSALLFLSPLLAQPGISLAPLGTYASGIFDEGAAEIATYDVKTQRLFITNANANTVDVVDISLPASPVLAFTLSLDAFGGGVNSVASWYGTIAVAVEDTNKQNPGKVVFFSRDGKYLNDLTVGALPDMLAFSPNGKYLVVANEGEPDDNYTVDPHGSVSIIRMKKAKKLKQSDVTTIDFSSVNPASLDPGVRIFGPGASVAQDMEPEYIAVSDDSKTAFVACQENNAIVEINLQNGNIVNIWAMGYKDHSLPGNGLDASNRDDSILIKNWPVRGLYLPDAIDFLRWQNKSYLFTANEGDSRDYDGYSEEERIEDVTLDPGAFPNAAQLQDEDSLGRLKITSSMGDTDGDGDYDELYSYGARSFSIWRTNGQLVYDSGDDFEQITAAILPDDFNSTNDENGSGDDRSDDKGPEPEGIVLGKVKGRTYAFIGLERVGGIMVYDVTNPNTPTFVQYINNRDFSGDAELGTAGDLGPEGLIFIKGWQSPTQNPLLVVTNEVSGTTTVYEINEVNTSREANTFAGSELAAAPAVLLPNAPNPFRGYTDISFSVNEHQQVEIILFDLFGNQVRTLASQSFHAGKHSVRWDATNDFRTKVVPGVYICIMKTSSSTQARKIIYYGE